MKAKDWVLLFIILIVCFGTYFIWFKPDNKQIDIINAKINKLDSLNKILVKKDSLLILKIDTLKTNYSKSKGKYKDDKDKFKNTRSTIALPDL
jgi:preprotein translocase subunit YajC